MSSPVPADQIRQASTGSLESQTLADLIALKKAAEVQMQAYRDLWGSELTFSRSREHLLRSIVIEFGFGRIQPERFYAEAMSFLFTSEEITQETLQLEYVGLIVYGDDDELAPSQRVVDWYNRFLPMLMEGAADIIKAR